MRLPVVFIMITVTLDAMGIGLILPVMPDLIAEVRGITVDRRGALGRHPGGGLRDHAVRLLAH
jgi:hypothetical protein